MNQLRITADQLAIVAQQAIDAYPDECCGLLIGSRSLDAAPITGTPITGTPIVTVESVHITRNAWSDEQAAMLAEAISVVSDSDPQAHSRRDRFWIDPADLFAALKSSRDRGVEIVGIYHSHPDHPAIPSATDLQLAWPEYAYLIVSVRSGLVVDQRSWQLHGTEFAAMAISISDAPPLPPANPVE
jgi:proteasome lid subunit RPN8/RPN11